MPQGKTYSASDVRQILAKTIKDRVQVYEGQMLALRKREESSARGEESSAREESPARSESSASVLPGDEESQDLTPGDGPDAGSGGEVKKGKKLGKGDVPMSKPPTKAPTAAPPKSSAGAPKVGAAPAGPAPMAKSVASLRKSAEEHLAKAGPRLGGKDPASQQMTQHAFASAGGGAAPAAAPKTQMPTPEEHAARNAQFADFTPKGAFDAPGAGATAGAMKPAKAPPPGVGHLTPPSAAPGKPMGTSAAPKGGLLQRFSDALHGKKAAPAPSPAMKTEKK